MQSELIVKSIADRYQNFIEAVQKGKVSNDLAQIVQADRWAYPVTKEKLGIANYGGADIQAATPNSIAFTVSTYDIDRDGDCVNPAGFVLTNYKKNPIWFFGHQDWEIPIGKSLSPNGELSVFIEPNRVQAVCYFDTDDPDAMFIHGKVIRGFLNATSVAFVPLEAEKRQEEFKSHHQQSAVGWNFSRVDLTEISIVGVPSNQNSIVAGALRDSLDKEKSFITPKLQKALVPYCAEARGKCFSGWCPCPPCEVKEQSSKVVKKLDKAVQIVFPKQYRLSVKRPKNLLQKNINWQLWLSVLTDILLISVGNIPVDIIMEALEQDNDAQNLYTNGNTPQQAAAKLKPKFTHRLQDIEALARAATAKFFKDPKNAKLLKRLKEVHKDGNPFDDWLFWFKATADILLISVGGVTPIILFNLLDNFRDILAMYFKMKYTPRQAAQAIENDVIALAHKTGLIKSVKKESFFATCEHDPHTGACLPKGGSEEAKPAAKPAREKPEGEHRHHLDDLFAKIGKAGGFTYEPVSHRQPKEGFVVSPYPQFSQGIDLKILKCADLVKYVKKNKKVLEQKGHFLGAWTDKESGKVFLDVVIVAPDEAKADEIAKTKDQIAYWDLKNKKEVVVNRNATSGGQKHAKRTAVPVNDWIGLHRGRSHGSVQTANGKGTDSRRTRGTATGDAVRIQIPKEAVRKLNYGIDNHRDEIVAEFEGYNILRGVDDSGRNAYYGIWNGIKQNGPPKGKMKTELAGTTDNVKKLISQLWGKGLKPVQKMDAAFMEWVRLALEAAGFFTGMVAWSAIWAMVSDLGPNIINKLRGMFGQGIPPEEAARELRRYKAMKHKCGCKDCKQHKPCPCKKSTNQADIESIPSFESQKGVVDAYLEKYPDGYWIVLGNKKTHGPYPTEEAGWKAYRKLVPDSGGSFGHLWGDAGQLEFSLKSQKDAQVDCVSNKIKIIAADHPEMKEDQRVAIAYSYCDGSKKCARVIGSKKLKSGNKVLVLKKVGGPFVRLVLSKGKVKRIAKGRPPIGTYHYQVDLQKFPDGWWVVRTDRGHDGEKVPGNGPYQSEEEARSSSGYLKPNRGSSSSGHVWGGSGQYEFSLGSHSQKPIKVKSIGQLNGKWWVEFSDGTNRGPFDSEESAMAVHTQDDVSAKSKALGESSGTAGGYTIPPDRGIVNQEQNETKDVLQELCGKLLDGEKDIHCSLPSGHKGGHKKSLKNPTVQKLNAPSSLSTTSTLTRLAQIVTGGRISPNDNLDEIYLLRSQIDAILAAARQLGLQVGIRDTPYGPKSDYIAVYLKSLRGVKNMKTRKDVTMDPDTNEEKDVDEHNEVSNQEETRVVPHQAQVLANLHQHLQHYHDYLDQEKDKFDPTPIKDRLLSDDHKSKVDGLMEEHKSDFEEHFPELDMKDLQSTPEHQGEELSGEAKEVAEGDVPPEDEASDEDEPATEVPDEDEPSTEDKDFPDEEFDDDNEEATGEDDGEVKGLDGEVDSASDEILERYQGKRKKAKTKTKTKKKDLDGGSPVPDDVNYEHKDDDGLSNAGDKMPKHTAIKEASEYLDEFANGADTKAMHKAGARHHSMQLKGMLDTMPQEDEGIGGTVPETGTIEQKSDDADPMARDDMPGMNDDGHVLKDAAAFMDAVANNPEINEEHKSACRYHSTSLGKHVSKSEDEPTEDGGIPGEDQEDVIEEKGVNDDQGPPDTDANDEPDNGQLSKEVDDEGPASIDEQKALALAMKELGEISTTARGWVKTMKQHGAPI
jgi:hypothetical protein